jgi:dihydroorotate dehydrogenase (fumarate)
MINSEKWSDYSADQWVNKEIPEALAAGVKVVASIGHTSEEVEAWLPSIDALGVPFFELVSYDEESMIPMVKKAVSLTKTPILAKISPNWADPVGAAMLCLEAGAAGITAIDSLGPVLSIDIKTARPNVGGAGGMGWLTGSALKPLALRYVAEIAGKTHRPVLGLGGVMSPEDAMEMVLAGASAVGLCTYPMLSGTEGLQKLIRKFDILLSDLGYTSFEKARGKTLPFLAEAGNEKHFFLSIHNPKCRLCGICITRCPYNALSKKGETLILQAEHCRRCGLCVSSCPDENLSLVEEMR